MSRYNVQFKAKWACFSSIVDGFITEFMGKSDYEQWRKCEYGISNYKPADECNIMTMKEALYSIRLHNSSQDSKNQLISCGLCEQDAELLIHLTEMEYFCPVNQDGTFKCPNCGDEVSEGQPVCKEETCELEFVWG